jgi:hypothetical protein
MSSAASISLLQHRGVPTKAASSVVTSPVADMQDAIAKLKKEEADAERTLADLQSRLSYKDSLAYSQAAQPYEPVVLAQQQNAVQHFEAAVQTEMSGTQDLPMGTFVEPPRQEAASVPMAAPADARQEVSQPQYNTVQMPSYAQQSQPSQVSQPQYNAVQAPRSPVYAQSQPMYGSPQSQSRRSSSTDNLMQTKLQDQGSSALMNRLISAELAQTQALLQIQARQDELEKREMALEEEKYEIAMLSTPNCTDYTKNGCGPVSDQSTCTTCCNSDGLRGGSYKTQGGHGVCSCKVKENSYRTICHGIKTNLSMLTMMLGVLATYLHF